MRDSHSILLIAEVEFAELDPRTHEEKLNALATLELLNEDMRALRALTSGAAYARKALVMLMKEETAHSYELPLVLGSPLKAFEALTRAAAD